MGVEVTSVSWLSRVETITEEDTSYKKFTFHPWANQKFQKIFKEFNITVAPINEYNIKNLIKTNHKDKDPIVKKSGVYKIDCKQCEKVYIGQTKRNVETRTNKHFGNLRLNHTDKSAIASHFWNTGHEINNTASILKSVNKKNELITWREKKFIPKHAHHIMNFKVPPVSSVIRKYIFSWWLLKN